MTPGEAIVAALGNLLSAHDAVMHHQAPLSVLDGQKEAVAHLIDEALKSSSAAGAALAAGSRLR